MKAEITYRNKTFRLDLSKPLDISITLSGNEGNPIAWHLEAPEIKPVRDGEWIGKVSEGASTNFNNIYFNPHGHGTHTECVGHISPEFRSINDSLKTFFFTAKLISVAPEQKKEDRIISREQLEKVIGPGEAEALIIRTFPNKPSKCEQKYSHSNWPYLEENAARYIRECGIQHLLIDLPSVDKEKDEGKLLAHRAFWDYPENTRINSSITELIYVPTTIEDGNYILNLQIASFENDAAPSKPVLYKPE